MIRIGIVGIGKWGKNLLKEFSKISVIPICVTKGNNQNKKWLKTNYPKIKSTKNYYEILQDEDIDAVIIATPIKTHFKLAYEALSAGKHVFIEKTISENSSDGEKLLELAKKNHLVIFVGYEFLYHPIFQKIKDIENKEKILQLKCEWSKFGSFEENIFHDLVSHFLTIIIVLFGLPKKINFLEQVSIITKCDITTLNLEFKNRLKASIYVNRVATPKRRLINIITKKNLYIWENEELFKFKKIKNQKIKIKRTSPLENESKEFLNEIKKSKYNYKNPEIAINALKLIENQV